MFKSYDLMCTCTSSGNNMSAGHSELHLCFIQETNDLRGNTTPLFTFRFKSVHWNRTQRQQFALEVQRIRK
jgi:hypothetical protein